MNILRFGSTHGSPSRYLDLLDFDEIDKVIWLTHEDDLMVKKVFEECRRLNPLFDDKVKLITYSIPSHVKFMSRVIQFIHTRNQKASKRLDYLYNLFDFIIGLMQPKIIKRIVEEESIDFVWSGNNDSDNVNVLLWMFSKGKRNKLPVLHSYQEHRCSFRIDEKHSILRANKLIVPSKANMESFEKTYSIYLGSKTVYGNEDWRSKKLIDYIEQSSVSKYSDIDGEPHVIILARYATYGKDRFGRRGSRINYLQIIEKMVKNGIHIHLNCLQIVEDIESKRIEVGNPYEMLKMQYPKYFHIDEPFDMNDWNSYLELKKYDAGILHNVVDGEKVNEFSHMNVPNRFFEYLICNVQPIILKNKMQDVEEFIHSIDFGVLGRDYDEISNILKEQIKDKSVNYPSIELKSKYSFEKFISILLHQHGRLSLPLIEAK